MKHSVELSVELWQYSNLLGLIVLLETGVNWSNQTGGLACRHPVAEGIFLPLYGDVPDDTDEFYDDSGSPYNIERVQRFLIDNLLDDQLEPDPDATEVMEAWIPVKIKETCENFKGMRAIVTYDNSD